MVTVRRPKPRVESSAESVEPSMYGPASKYYGIGEGIPGIQRTIAIIRPKAYVAHKEEILSRIKDAGFVIAIQKEVTLTDSQAQEYYKGRKEEPDYEELIKMVADQPMLVLLLAKNEAIKAWKDLLGPEDVEKAKLDAPDCLRAQYYITESEVDEEGNVTESREVDQLEGSADEEDVERGLDFFFPVERTLAAIKPDAYANRDEIIERIKSAGFQIASKKDVQLTEEVAAQYYADVKDKPFFDDLVKHMASGHSLFLVLTRRDAIAGWRKLMGSTDPDKAADESPDKDDPNLMNLRATYGKNVLENAVHGASDEQHAARAIELIFGDPNVGLPGETSPEGEEEGGAEGQGEEGQLEGQEDKAEGEESKAEGEEIKAEGEKSKAEDEEGKPEGEEGAEAEPATKPGEEESAEKTEGTEKPEGEIPGADKPQEEAPDADKAEPQASETAAEEAGTASKEEKPPSEEKADEPPPEPESTPASPDEPVEVAEGQADDVMAENQNASADPSTRRTSATGTSSRPTSDYSQKSGGRKRSADGETRLSSNQSHRYTPEGKGRTN
ncbi:unnamed protein product [Calicophoron daubneyi]|uniref:Nucleoside diphosphate kinase-like domain-containing protein n=1 Tax=Calicophoron daubneyi TaxID=300641 RepID=A0AAV2TVS3_CALDB